MTDPTLGGWARLVSKLPTLRGISNWFYVSANWGHISADFERYRLQIKDREEWANRALTQQGQLHELGMQRAALELEVELQGLRRLVEQMIQHMRERGDRIEVERSNSLALIEGTLAGLRQTTQALEERTSSWVDCLVLLAQLLEREGPLTRTLLLSDLDERSRVVVEILIELTKALKRGDSFPPGSTPPGLGLLP